MISAIIAIIMALVSFFGSKKAGASDGQAAAIAAGAGLGTYYVANNTEWGKGIVSTISEWVGLKDENGTPILNKDGTPVKAPPGAKVVLDEAGQPVRDTNGNVMWKLVDSAGNVLESWGPTGTATVIGTGALATQAEEFPWLWVGVGAVAILLLN